jgi:hypothetical protein
MTYSSKMFRLEVEICTDLSSASSYLKPKGLKTKMSKETLSNSSLSSDFWVEFTALLMKLSR